MSASFHSKQIQEGINQPRIYTARSSLRMNKHQMKLWSHLASNRPQKHAPSLPANRVTQRCWSPMGSTGGRNPHQSQPEVLEWIWLKFVTKNSTEIQVSQNVEDVESFKRSQQHFSLLANTFQSLFHLLLNNK